MLNPVYTDAIQNTREKKTMKQYVVDAFTDRVFHGNQAAVCVLDEWLSEELMMNITRENLGELDLSIKVDIAENDYAEKVAKQLKEYQHKAPQATVP